MLKFIMKSLEGLDPAIAALYTKQDGADQYVLTGIENVVHKQKIDEFRTNNIELQKKLDAFKDIDPAKYASLLTEIEEARIKLKDTENFDEKVNEIVEQRVANINKTSADEIAKRDGIIKTQGDQLETLIIDGSVNDAAIEAKVRTSALTDVLLRAKTVFKLEGGKPVAKDSEGNKMYGADGVSELSPGEWVTGLIKTSPHLFQESVTGNLQDGSGRSFSGDTSNMSATNKIAAGLNSRQ